VPPVLQEVLTVADWNANGAGGNLVALLVGVTAETIYQDVLGTLAPMVECLCWGWWWSLGIIFHLRGLLSRAAPSTPTPTPPIEH